VRVSPPALAPPLSVVLGVLDVSLAPWPVVVVFSALVLVFEGVVDGGGELGAVTVVVVPEPHPALSAPAASNVAHRAVGRPRCMSSIVGLRHRAARSSSTPLARG
jgi:hypothetical protein